MLTPKCKVCQSPWHYKPKCPEREIKPFKAVYASTRAISPLLTENASERPRIAYKGKSERSQCIGEADSVFSLYIRQRGSDMGYNHCYTCGVRLLIGELQCGHFISRRFMATRWHVLNCWPQCNDCNVVKRGNLEVYERKLVANYGQEAIDELKALAHAYTKTTLQDINEVIINYKGLVY